jgi:hypothetical protein
VTITILGTSNCIVHGSFVGCLRPLLTEDLRNLSIGASSSSVGMYFLDDCRFKPDDTVVIDYVINDTGYLSAGLKTEQDVKAQLGSIATAVRAAEARLLLLILPSLSGLIAPDKAEAVHVSFCLENLIPFLNIAELFRIAVRRGFDRGDLLRDPSHMSPRTAPAIGRLVAQSIDRVKTGPQAIRPVSTPSRRSRRLLAADMAGPLQYTEHASSLHRAKFAVLRSGDMMRLPIGEREALIGLMINTGAFGAQVALSNDELTIVKPMTIYWDAARPDWFTAILVDLLCPLQGSETGIVIRVTHPDAAPTEATLHQKPSLEGRYGEIEVEGFLIGSRTIQTVVQEVGTLSGSLDMLSYCDLDALLGTLTGGPEPL